MTQLVSPPTQTFNASSLLLQRNRTGSNGAQSGPNASPSGQFSASKLDQINGATGAFSAASLLGTITTDEAEMLRGDGWAQVPFLFHILLFHHLQDTGKYIEG